MFSTTIGAPRLLPIPFASRRAMMSVAVPAPVGTISRIGRVGQADLAEPPEPSCACAPNATARHASTIAAVRFMSIRARGNNGRSARLPQMIAQQRPVARDAVAPIEQAEARPQAHGIVGKYRLAELAFEPLDHAHAAPVATRHDDGIGVRPVGAQAELVGLLRTGRP